MEATNKTDFKTEFIKCILQSFLNGENPDDTKDMISVKYPPERGEEMKKIVYALAEHSDEIEARLKKNTVEDVVNYLLNKSVFK